MTLHAPSKLMMSERNFSAIQEGKFDEAIQLPLPILYILLGYLGSILRYAFFRQQAKTKSGLPASVEQWAQKDKYFSYWMNCQGMQYHFLDN